jgi:Phosphotransferase enzyme family
MELPMAINGITRHWMSEALSVGRSPVVVDSMEELKVLHGGATKIRYRLKYAPNKSADLPEILWLKIGFEPHHEYVETIMRAYTAEVNAYNKIVPAYDVHTPKPFFAYSQESPSQAAILLEDLTLRGVTFNGALNPISVDTAAAGLETLAHLHAKSWGDPRLDGYSFLHLPLSGPPGKVFADFVGDAERYFKCLRGYSIPVQLHNKERFAAALPAYIRFASRGPHCFLHGDAHVGNTYTERDGSVGILDWQMICKGYWAHEIGYFLSSALDVPDRRSAERDLLGHYLTHLQKNGVDAPKFADAWDDYRRSMFYAFIVWLGNSDEWQIPEINLACLARAGVAMIDHDTYNVLGV